MGRRIFALLLLLGSAFIANGQFGPCPSNCECTGIVPGVCTSCREPNRDVSSKCTKCKEGYVMSQYGHCVISTQSCPSYCECRGFVPWTCTNCVDPNKDLDSKCRTCKKGYKMNRYGVCVSTTPEPTRRCPSECQCRGFVPWTCTSCNDPHADLGTQCRTCEPGYIQRGHWRNCERVMTGGPDPVPGGIPGGITPQPNVNSVPDFPQVNAYVLQQKPELSGAVVTKLSTQIVAGTNFYITYETATTKWDVVVWLQTWTNTIQITSFTVTNK